MWSWKIEKTKVKVELNVELKTKRVFLEKDEFYETLNLLHLKED